jgi:hypothetical protein
VVEEGDAGIQCRPDGRSELFTRLPSGLVEGHQTQTDRADVDAADGVVSDCPCSHAALLPGDSLSYANVVKTDRRPA